MIELALRGVGVLGPGLAGWAAARRVLAGEERYRWAEPPEPRPEALPQNERRRGARTVRWAIAAAEEAMQASGLAGAETASVFASSSADGETLHHICQALAAPAREVSPTRFHNSVHNAAAGYWSIASGSRRPSVTLCGHDASFAAGLLEAACLARDGERAVLLVVYDLPYPEPLLAVRRVLQPLAVGLLFSAADDQTRLAKWRLSLETGAPATPSPIHELDSNPAARALPLLAAVAGGAARVVGLDCGNGQSLEVESAP